MVAAARFLPDHLVGGITMIAQALLTGIEEVRRNWGWFLALGIALIVLGVLALGAVGLTTIAVVLMVGWLVLIGGVLEVVSAFWARQWSGFFLHLLVGFLYVVVGLLILSHPVGAAAGFTLVLAALFLTGGIFRIVAAAMLRYPNWGWSVLDGAVSLALGILIWTGWPSSALEVIGTFVGIILIFRGWAWVMFALAVRRLPSTAEEFRRSVTDERVPSPM
jgi:uncharacterized membrane protein HdeD (DUF308 family)